MNLAWKLVISHVAAILVGLFVLAVFASFIGPTDFSSAMASMMGSSTSGMMGDAMQNLGTILDVHFRLALTNALLIAGGIAALVGIGLSLFLSQRIVRPIRQIASASQRIAAGHYEEHLANERRDEIGELTHSFNCMAVALAETEKMRAQLFADVTHELKTPLASIKGYMEGLQDGVIAATPETFQLIHREADRLQRLVLDLQELSRAEAAQLHLDIHACSAAALVEAAMETLRPQFDDKGVTLHTEFIAQPLNVLADPDRVRQVLINLLGNALQYTPPGGRVTVRLGRRDNAAQFSVEDTGVGLAADDLTRIFQRFYRVDKSRARASGGSGIGLTIARYIVEAHGGRIWAESAGPGKGSVFHFTLPLA